MPPVSATFRVAVTGGIGSGKSTVTRALSDLGAAVVDADKIAREVVEPGSAGLERVVAAFGDNVRASDGSLDRAALAAVVFSSPAERVRLESIVHPLIRERTLELFAGVPNGVPAIHDIPLLLETSSEGNYPLTISVEAPLTTRLERLVTHRGVSEDDARRRLTAQRGDLARASVTDETVDNGGTLEQTNQQVRELWERRIAPFVANWSSAIPSSGQATPGRTARRYQLAFEVAGCVAAYDWSIVSPTLHVRDVRDSAARIAELLGCVRTKVSREHTTASWASTDPAFPIDISVTSSR